MPNPYNSGSRRPDTYRVTFLDRMGAAGAVRLKVLQWGLTALGLFIPLFAAAAARLDDGIPVVWKLVWILGCIAGCTAMVCLAALLVSDGAGFAYSRLMVDGAGTPYEEDFSREQALVMQRRVDDALVLFEERIAADPTAVAPRLRAAELYAREASNPVRAAQLFREVQRIPGIDTGTDVQASMRLVDLCLGPLQDPGRALVELRRIVDRHPGSAVADHARVAIAKLKVDLGVTPPDGSPYSS